MCTVGQRKRMRWIVSEGAVGRAGRVDIGLAGRGLAGKKGGGFRPLFV